MIKDNGIRSRETEKKQKELKTIYDEKIVDRLSKIAMNTEKLKDITQRSARSEPKSKKTLRKTKNVVRIYKKRGEIIGRRNKLNDFGGK